MAREIERKFLVDGDRWRTAVHGKVRLTQGYISRDPLCSVRVRLADDQAWLTIKSGTNPLDRHEFEFAIPIADAREMLAVLCVGPVIDKWRHHVDAEDGHAWTIDEFIEPVPGLVMAELELAEADEAFAKPRWLGREVTGDSRYLNSNLG